MFCGTVEMFVETYKGYDIFEVWQTDLATDEILTDGAMWFKAVNKITGDKITSQFFWQIKNSLDYRIKANPHMFGIGAI